MNKFVTILSIAIIFAGIDYAHAEATVLASHNFMYGNSVGNMTLNEALEAAYQDVAKNCTSRKAVIVNSSASGNKVSLYAICSEVDSDDGRNSEGYGRFSKF